MSTTTNHLTPAELDALLEAARAATGGPWGVFPSNSGNLARVETQGETTAEQGQGFTVCAIPKTRTNDAEFIAAANPATIQRLVLMVQELQRTLTTTDGTGVYNEEGNYTLLAKNAIERCVSDFRARAVRALQQQAKYSRSEANNTRRSLMVTERRCGSKLMRQTTAHN